MVVILNGITYYQTAEACKLAGISRNTYLRWVKERKYTDVKHRDRRNWRLFTDDELKTLKSEANRINKI